VTRRHDGSHWKAQRSEEEARASSDSSRPCRASDASLLLL
jgi:hypothetical protein